MLKDHLIGRVGESKAKAVQLPLIKELEVREQVDYLGIPCIDDTGDYAIHTY